MSATHVRAYDALTFHFPGDRTVTIDFDATDREHADTLFADLAEAKQRGWRIDVTINLTMKPAAGADRPEGA